MFFLGIDSGLERADWREFSRIAEYEDCINLNTEWPTLYHMGKIFLKKMETTQEIRAKARQDNQPGIKGS